MIDALRYEYVRLRTLRSTYWLIGIAMTFQLVMSIVIAAVVASSDSAIDDDTVFDVLATIGASSGFAPLFIAFVIGLLGVFSTGHEYRHGMIRATLTAIPNRTHVFVAKIVSTVIVSALAALLCILIALLCVLAFGLQPPSIKDFVDMTAGTTIFTVLFSLSGLAYGALTRNQTAAVAMLVSSSALAQQSPARGQLGVLGLRAPDGEDRWHKACVRQASPGTSRATRSV